MLEAQRSLPAMRTMLLTATAMLAFAANSLLCRLALQQGAIDPASFSSIRLVAGALTLAIIVRLTRSRTASSSTDWVSAAMLFSYVAFFSFAYLTLSAGTGALILFGAVQLTMFSGGLRAGEMFGITAWLGFAMAVAGLLYLVSPGITSPPLFGALLMTIAGIAWGVYSLRGRGISDPLVATARNFAYAVPLALLMNLLFIHKTYLSNAGIILAIASGALTSGIGYVIWYAALNRLSALQAATVQLSVPLIAAFGGVTFLSETITSRLAVASIGIIGGITLVLIGKSKTPRA